MRQLVIKDMAFTDVTTVIGTLIYSELLLIYVEGVRHLVLFILGINLTKHLEDLEVTCQSV